MKLSDFKATACIMYPATWPEDSYETHCTIAFLGEIAELSYGVEDLQRVLRQFNWPKVTVAATAGLDWFGPDKNIPVVRLLGENLRLNYHIVKNALAGEGIAVDETYPVYKPHITVNYYEVFDPTELAGSDQFIYDPKQYMIENLDIPDTVGLKTPEIWWGNEHYSI